MNTRSRTITPALTYLGRAPTALYAVGGSSSGEPGFSLNEGLRRHLVGFGKTWQCPVFKAAEELVRDSLDRRLGPAERAQESNKAAEQEARRKTETLFKIAPGARALLLDEGHIFRQSRRPDMDADGSLTWAEQRLFSLGFTINVDGNIKSYTRRIQSGIDGELVVYADPRSLGEIVFHVFRSAKRGAPKRLNSFKIRDAWKKNLDDKLRAGIDAVAARS